MKTIHLIIAALTASIFLSCSNDDYSMPEIMTANSEESEYRTYDEAKEIALQSMAILEPSETRSAGSCRTIDDQMTKVYVSNRQTRGGCTGKDTLYYVFNFSNDEGFSIVSAPKNAKPLLAVTEKGHYDPAEGTNIKGLQQFLGSVETFLEESSETPIYRAPGTPFRDSIVYHTTQRGPFVTVKWGQTHPEGEYCPNGVSGCTNTALAQIMSYYAYPDDIDLTFQGTILSNIVLSWEQMKAHQTGHSMTSCSTPVVHMKIGCLLRQLGEMNHSSYDSINMRTGTYDYYVPYTMANLGYNMGNWYSHNWNYLKGQLNSSHLMYISGIDDEENAGHGWVLDGYKEITKTTYQFVPGIDNIWVIGRIITETTQLCHYNWGWYGDCNGYFLSDVFETQGGELYEQTQVHDYDLSTDVWLLSLWR